MSKASIKSYNRPYSKSRSKGKGWYEKSVYVPDAGRRVAPRHRDVALKGSHSKPGHTPISSHYSRQLMNRGNIQRTIPKAPKKSYDTGHTIHNVDMVELKQNDVNVFVDGEGNIISYSYQHDGTTIKIPEVGAVKQREKIYTKRSSGHPAKMYTPLAQKIIQDYSEPGDTILDPMAGIGTTGIEASRLGRNAIIVDYEKRFVDEAKKNVILLEKSGQKIGDIKVVHGDARNLGKIRNVDVVITSPPFEDSLAIIGNMSIEKQRKYGLERPSDKLQKSGYSRNLDNIGNKKEYAYIEDMKKVYSECHKSLKSEGKMIVHMKNHIKDGKIIRLDQKTKTLVESTNFKFVEKRKRHINNPSAWTNIYRKQHPDAPQVNYEDILVFKKVSNL